MSSDTVSLLRLHVVADTDPSALARVFERFQNLNIVPRRFTAEWGTDDVLHIQVDVCGLPDEHLALIAGKIAQAPSIINAHWHRV
jgi:hypothetical protein